MSWHHRSACLARPDLPWDSRGGKGRAEREAIRVCRGCPVLPQCLVDAQRAETASTAYGIRAGLTQHERRALWASPHSGLPPVATTAGW